ncbi:MAG: hypothetical protein AAGB48_09140 [Planctomycetota bacterium]
MRLALCALSLLLPTGTVAGQLIPFDATFEGVVNGQAVAAEGSGMIDVEQRGRSSASVTFDQRPDSFDPVAVSLISNLCTNAFQTGLARGKTVQNLFDLAGGNYSLTRAFQWIGLPGSAVTIESTVTNDSEEPSWSSESIISGTYGGPTDIVGISSYSVIWLPGSAPGEFFESGTAVLERANGESLVMQFASVFSGLSGDLTNVQFGSGVFDTSFDGTTLELNWDGLFVIPSPGTSVLLAGCLGLACRRRRR